MGGSVLGSAFDLRSGQMIMAALLLMAGSFYAGTLFGNKAPLYVPRTLSDSSSNPNSTSSSSSAHYSSGLSAFPNKVELTYRKAPLVIPESGMDVCPLTFNEYIPCHDVNYVKELLPTLNLSRREELERHCPPPEKRLFCLVPPPEVVVVPWWWYSLQARGAAEYIERLGNMTTNEAGDLRSAGVVQVLDVGCGVASFSAYLLPLGIQTMSFAPKDGHENQIQFALERGIGAMIAAIATKQLPYPSSSFEMVHCSRCRVDWHENDGILLKELNRLLRPNGYFVYSAPPAYKKDKEFPMIWDKLVNLTGAMCWKLIAKKVQTAIWIKQNDQSCLQRNVEEKLLNLCETTDESKPSWNVPLQNCISLSTAEADSEKLPPRPERLSLYSKSLGKLGFSQEEFASDTIFWQEQVQRYWELMKINEAEIRNVMDMNAVLGGFAVALNTFPVWVMNVVPISTSNTLSAIYDRGLVGTFHDWCEPFSTYPRTYDLLHANNLLAYYKSGGEGCLLEDIILEMDRILRPEGFIIIRDEESTIQRIRDIAPKFLWEVESHMLENKEKKLENVLVCQKKFWAIV
ncbi:hypothetical protein NL676_017011 [Syzygium grande]|nr:hypothetical protein NL676_017011 [Syzygium grande]